MNESKEENTIIDVWFTIPKFPNYEISRYGIVRRRIDKIELRNYPSKSGCRFYMTCGIGRIHRLLGSAMTGRILRKSEFVCHVNGSAFDNRVENLIISNAKQNSMDRVKHNTNGIKLRNQDVCDLRILAKSKSKSWLASRYGISVGHVYKIITGSSWANLPC